MSQATQTVFVAPVELSEAAWEAFVAASAGDGGSVLGGPTREAVEAAVATQVRDVQAKVEDAGVRAARDQGWCGVFSSTMWKIFPAGPLDGQDWRDSEGVSCNGNRWTDAEGYGRDGFNDSGLDREGYNREGRDRSGFTRDGLDQDGIHRDAPERFRFDRRGKDIDGFDASGYLGSGITRAELAERRAKPEDYVFDRDGYDRDGYNRSGFHRETRRNRFGFDSSGWHTDTQSYYDADGYDQNGYHRETGAYRERTTS